MPTTFAGIVMDTPQYKIFDILVPEDDAINVVTILTFNAGGLTDFDEDPQVFWSLEETQVGATPTVNTTVGIYAVSATGFRTMRDSVAPGAPSGVSHTYRVFMTSRKIWQL